MVDYNTRSVNNKGSVDWSARLREIRPFVSFNYDLRHTLKPHQKAKINKYRKALQQLSSRDYYLYRPRSKKRLKAAQKFAQHPAGTSQIKAAFIPSAGGEKPKISFTKNNVMVVKTENVTVQKLFFDKNIMAIDDRDKVMSHVNDVLDQLPKIKKFTILVESLEISQLIARSLVAEEVWDLIETYKLAELITGVSAYTYTNQSTLDTFMTDKRSAKKVRGGKALRARRARNKFVLRLERLGYPTDVINKRTDKFMIERNAKLKKATK